MTTSSCKCDLISLSTLSRVVRRLSVLDDLDALFRLVAETLLQLEVVAAVEVRLFASRRSRSSAEFSLRADGTRASLFTEPSDCSIIDAVAKTREPLFAPLSGTGVEPGVDVTHVLAVPLPAPDEPETVPPPPFGGVFIGFTEIPDLSSACRHTIDILVSCVANRVHGILSEQACCRHTAHMALLHDVSAMTVQSSRGERLFSQAVRLIEETFDLDMVAVYAGQPLTLRALFGGQVGESVPEGLAHQASRRQQSMVSELSSKLSPSARTLSFLWDSRRSRLERCSRRWPRYLPGARKDHL